MDSSDYADLRSNAAKTCKDNETFSVDYLVLENYYSILRSAMLLLMYISYAENLSNFVSFIHLLPHSHIEPLSK